MTEETKGKESFRPYARLVSILGDQLISNKWIGVIELVKNCYDADAEDVNVRFVNFSDPHKENRIIEIEDDGDGMTLDIIQNIWMKPATPNKLNKKRSAERFTKKGRLMQGDKGVGRFAIYKLGNLIEIFTKTSETEEIKLTINFRDFTESDEFGEPQTSQPKFLDEVTSNWEKHQTPEKILNSKKQGTLIRISDLRNNWDFDDLDKLDKAFYKMIPPLIPGLEKRIHRDFFVKLFWNNVEVPSSIMPFEKIIDLAPFSFEGSIEDDGRFTFIYRHNRKEAVKEINLFADINHDVAKLKLFRERFYYYDRITKKYTHSRNPSVGEFNFFFYAYDWMNKLEGLTSVEEEYIKENSVYLYRDFTRVYPYGERGVDWLMLSKFRAEDRAGSYFSYNDLVGFIFIKQDENPNLRDAADREGLMNIDGTYDDFVALVQAALKVMKDYVEVDKKRDVLRKEKPFRTLNDEFENAYAELNKKLSKSDDPSLLTTSKKLFQATNNLLESYKDKVSIAQELAGIGMAVEKSSHDTFAILKKLRSNVLEYSEKFENGTVTKDELMEFLEDVIENLDFLYQELQVLQPLFRVARKVTKDVVVKEVAARVVRYFKRDTEGEIEVRVKVEGDLVIKTNTGLVLQVLINLMDNAVYWLKQEDIKDKKILIFIDGNNNRLIFADNGPGINQDISEMIFSEFFSMKAEGRGLGLYIVRELLERISAQISVIENPQLKILPGANFLLQFADK